MGQPSIPPAMAPSHPPPPPLLPGNLQVRCAGCRTILSVAPGLTEFSCPQCKLPQMLPPELMPAFPQGIDPTKIQMPCARCKAILNVPHGLTRFACPQCGVDLAIDVSKLQQYMPLPAPFVPPEEVNEHGLI